MLGKLLKYELKATGRVLLPAFAALLAIALASSFIVSGSPFIQGYGSGAEYSSQLQRTMVLVMTMLYMAACAGTCAVCALISVQRFRRNILGPEGYVMNTIPVSPMANVAAKLITATLFQLVGILVVILSVFLFTSSIGIGDLITMLRYIPRIGPDALAQSLLALACGILSVVLFNIAVYAALSVGYSFNGPKLVISIAVFAALWIGGSALYISVLERAVMAASRMAVWAVNDITALCFEAVYIAIGLLVTNWFLKNRLNLE